MKVMKISRDVDVGKGVIQVKADSRKTQGRRRRFWPDDGRQFLARRPPHARQTAECRQQGAPATRADAGHIVEFR